MLLLPIRHLHLNPTSRPDADVDAETTGDSHGEDAAATLNIAVVVGAITTIPTRPGISQEIPTPGVHIAIGLAMHQTTVTADIGIPNPHPVSQTGVLNKAQQRPLRLNTHKPHLAPPMRPQRLQRLLQSALQGLRILTRITATATRSARADAAQSTEETAGYTTLHVLNT